MPAFYMDHQFRAAITHGHRHRGVDVLTAYEDARARDADEVLLLRATSLNRVLVTHDQAFLDLATHWQMTGREFSGIAFSVQKSIDVRVAIEYLELIAHCMSDDEMRNRIEYTPSKR